MLSWLNTFTPHLTTLIDFHLELTDDRLLSQYPVTIEGAVVIPAPPSTVGCEDPDW